MLLGLKVVKCDKLAGLGVDQLERTQSQIALQQQDAIGEEEIAAAAGGLLLLPSQLQTLEISGCSNVVICPNSLHEDKDRDAAGQSGDKGGGLQGLCSLETLLISDCPRFLSYSSSSSSCVPLPASLEFLSLEGAVGASTLLPLSNLTSLTTLYIKECGDLSGEGLWPLLAQGSLTALSVNGSPNFFAGSLLPHEQEPSKLHELETDNVEGMLVGPICALLSSSRMALRICQDMDVERFTKLQEDALQLLTSVEGIAFLVCDKLQSIPSVLHRLPNLKMLQIYECAAIRSLPKDGLPDTLQELLLEGCPAIRSLPNNCLPRSLRKLVIKSCPAIQLLPKVDDLSSTLQELDVKESGSNELRRQCRKLIGTIPIVKA